MVSPVPASMLFATALLLSGCDHPKPGPAGVGPDETLLQVSATGEAESRPDQARFSAGVSSIGANAQAASQANGEKMNAVVAALLAQGVAKDDVQTQQLTINRVEWGPNRNKFEASNTVSVRVRQVDKAGAVIGAVSQAGANILSGPELVVSNQQAGTRTAYAAAFKSAREKADALAEAAGMKVRRVLTIRDTTGGNAQPFPSPQAVVAQEADAVPPVLAGTTAGQVSVSVDFVLERK